MPKKFRGENSKATEARARKAAQQAAEADRKQKQLEDEYWRDDDKHVLKKQQRKDDKERKKTEQVERKKETQRLAEQEMADIGGHAAGAAGKSAGVAGGRAVKPLSRAEIEAEQQRRTTELSERHELSKKKMATVEEQDLPLENVNRLMPDDQNEARSVDDAIRLLSTQDEAVDQHPEKRVRAAYVAFEERNLPLLKAEHPSLKLSQLRQILHKDFNRSPENPLNQAKQ